MATYKVIGFDSPDYMGYDVVVRLTETDNDATLQDFIEKALTNYKNYVAYWMDGEAWQANTDEYGNLIDEIGYEEFLEEIRDNCYVDYVKDLPESEITPFIAENAYSTDEGEEVEW